MTLWALAAGASWRVLIRFRFNSRGRLRSVLHHWLPRGHAPMTGAAMTERGRYAARAWTQIDDVKLRALVLKSLNSRSIGVQMDRTEIAVRTRARRLNIILKKRNGAIRRWARPELCHGKWLLVPDQSACPRQYRLREHRIVSLLPDQPWLPPAISQQHLYRNSRTRRPT
jgi:hypothetical protein